MRRRSNFTESLKNYSIFFFYFCRRFIEQQTEKLEKEQEIELDNIKQLFDRGIDRCQINYQDACVEYDRAVDEWKRQSESI